MKQRVISKLIFIVVFCYSTHCGFTQSKDSCITKSSEVLVDAGGHKLHMDIEGVGSPVVIFENGSGDFSFIWSLVQQEIAKLTKTVSYDRGARCMEPQGPLPRTGKQICWRIAHGLKECRCISSLYFSRAVFWWFYRSCFCKILSRRSSRHGIGRSRTGRSTNFYGRRYTDAYT